MKRRYMPSSNPGWKVTLTEHFYNHAAGNLWYRIDRNFIPYKRWGVLYEMVFEHNLN